MVKRLLCACLTLVLLFCAAHSSALTAFSQEDALLFEQTQGNLPDVQSWFYPPQGIKPEDVSLTVAGTPMATDEVRPVSPDDPVEYFFLVDCSTSTTQSQMEAVKRSLVTFTGVMPKGASVTLITFGVRVEVLLERSQDADALRSAVQTLAPNQEGTLFFDALAKASALAGGEETARSRKLLFLFSDGVDYNLGGHTQEETERLLLDAGLSVYGLGFDTGSKTQLDHFGALTRTVGGQIAIVNPNSLEGAVRGFFSRIQSAWTVLGAAPTNHTYPNGAEIILTVSGQKAQSRAVLKHHLPDTTPPTILSATQQGEDTILLFFSEPVAGASLSDSYRLETQTGSLIGIAAASYEEKTLCATLTLSSPPEQAELAIACPGITDLSMEANLLKAPYPLSFSGPPAQDTGTDSATAPLIFSGLLLVAVAICVAAGVTYQKKRKAAALLQETPAFSPEQHPTAHEVLSPPLPGPVHFVQGELPVIRLEVANSSGVSRLVELPIHGTLFAGRSDICDIIFDDTKMSRQNFVIEEKSGAYTLTNFSQSTGTLLNGVPLQHPRPLRDGDVIEAGRERMVFRIGKAGS